MKTIYLSGGCFWGVEEYFSRLDGVDKTVVGYANGHKVNPTYEEVCAGNTGHSECVKVVYNEETITIDYILDKFFDVVDPTTIDRQKNDVGSQYKSGIYVEHETDLKQVKDYIGKIEKDYKDKIVTQADIIINFYEADEYHQKYLKKNPNGYCHIKFD